LRLALALLVLASCGHEAAAPQPAPAPSPAQAGPADAAPPDALVLDVPARGETPPPGEVKHARQYNTEGLVLKRAGKYAEAIAKFKAALVADSTSLFARYNLACTYNLAGDRGRAFALLAQFADPQCPKCSAILAHAATDPDWKDRFADADFKRLTDEPARVAQQTLAAAKQLAPIWLGCKADEVSKFVDTTGKPIDVTSVPCCCDKPGCDHTEHVPAVKLRQYFTRCDDRAHYLSDRIACDGSCCTYDGDIHDGDANTLLHVCFADAKGRPVITEMTIGLGP
jgi:hypothetical protein